MHMHLTFQHKSTKWGKFEQLSKQAFAIMDTTQEHFRLTINLIRGIRFLDEPNGFLSVLFSLVFILALWSLVPLLEIFLTSFRTILRANDVGAIGVLRAGMNPLGSLQRSYKPPLPSTKGKINYRRLLVAMAAVLVIFAVEIVFLVSQFSRLSEPKELPPAFKTSYKGVLPEEAYRYTDVRGQAALDIEKLQVLGGESNMSVSILQFGGFICTKSTGSTVWDDLNRSFIVSNQGEILSIWN